MNGAVKCALTVAICITSLSVVAVESCVAAGGICRDGGVACCSGPCIVPRVEIPLGTCTSTCHNDGYYEECSSNSDCCNGICNHGGYCGCIALAGTCTNSGECCSGLTCKDVTAYDYNSIIDLGYQCVP